MESEKIELTDEIEYIKDKRRKEKINSTYVGVCLCRINNVEIVRNDYTYDYVKKCLICVNIHLKKDGYEYIRTFNYPQKLNTHSLCKEFIFYISQFNNIDEKSKKIELPLSQKITESYGANKFQILGMQSGLFKINLNRYEQSYVFTSFSDNENIIWEEFKKYLISII